ncbi:MAG: aminotransferase class I/II-fold pyridoxal phosphate-dependent enzyme, partial [Oscillospiraceae bacterium]|nr:aminotransferase class I/II-fold pyridoxal phosphate-dependent enzyme [Oscillospiraceae bacterium]
MVSGSALTALTQPAAWDEARYRRLLNPVVTALAPSGIRRFFDLAETMTDVISLGVGEPDFQTPWHIRDAGIQSLKAGKTRYTSNAGLMELRQEIAAYMNRKYSLEYAPQGEILVTVGGSEAIDCCIRALLSAGDEVIIPEPSFVCYPPIVALCGGKTVFVHTRAEDEFRLTGAALRAAITPKTKLLVLPFPNNPTGAV